MADEHAPRLIEAATGQQAPRCRPRASRRSAERSARRSALARAGSPVAHRKRVMSAPRSCRHVAPGRCVRRVRSADPTAASASPARSRPAPSLAGLPVARSGRPPRERRRAASPGGDDAPKLRSGAPPERSTARIDTCVGEREAAVGIGDDPGELGPPAGGQTDGRRREIDAVAFRFARETTAGGQRPLAAAGRRSRTRAWQPKGVDPGSQLDDQPIRESARQPARRAATASSRSRRRASAILR